MTTANDMRTISNEELALQYDGSAATLKNSIRCLQQKLKTAPFAAIGSINYDISILQAMYYECLETSKELHQKAKKEKERINETKIAFSQ